MISLSKLPLLSALALFAPLSATAAPPDPKAKITFDGHVLPILKDHCLGCHNQDKAKGGLDLSTFGAVMEGGAGGAIVKPGDADASRLYTLTSHKEQPAMPPKSPMIDKDKVETIALWVKQGALENNGSKPVPVKPKADVSLKSVTRGRPEGPPPMPNANFPKQLVTAPTPHSNAAVALAASPWSPLIALGSQKQVLLYHGEGGELLGVIPFKHGMPTVVKFSRNGNLLLVGGGVGGKSGKVCVFDIRTGEQIIEVGNESDTVLAADISADQRQIALGGPGKMIRLYSTADGSLIKEVKKHTDWLTAIEFSPDAVLLTTADRSGGVIVWEAATGREFYNLRGHQAAITDVSWRDDSNVLATCSEDGTVRLWEMENGNQIKTWPAHGGGTQDVAWTHDNRLVTTGRDKVAKLWDGNGGMQKQFEGMADIGLQVAVAHDLTRVYAGDWSGTVKAYLLPDGKPVLTFLTNAVQQPTALDAARQVLVAKVAATTAAKANYDALTANVAKAQAELAAQQKLAADSTNAFNAANAAMAGAKANADKMTALMGPAGLKVQAVTVKAQAIGEASAKVLASATANKGNAELQTIAQTFKQQADAATAELAAAQKVVTDLTPQVVAANTAYAASQKATTDAQAAAKVAADGVPVKTQAVAAAQAAMNAAKPAFDKAAAEQAAAQVEVDKLSPKK